MRGIIREEGESINPHPGFPPIGQTRLREGEKRFL
jgi:hypothetical protein